MTRFHCAASLLPLYAASFLAIATASSVVSATAQPPPQATVQSQATPAQSAVVTAYQEYRAAMAQGRIPEAMAAAERAYSLTKTNDAYASRLGVLGYNYAVLLLSFGDPKLALPVAIDVNAAAQSGAPNTDKAAAAALLGQAKLAHDDASGAVLIRDALAKATPENEAQIGWAYRAGQALGTWASTKGDLPVMLEGWRAAERFSPGDGERERMQRAAALNQQIAVLVAQRQMREAYRVAHLASETLQPVIKETAGHQTTDLETVAAVSLGWRATVIAWAHSQRERLPQVDEALWTPSPLTMPRPCQLQVTPTMAGKRPFLSLPDTDRVGAVVMRIATDESGNPLDARLAASIGFSDAAFLAAVHTYIMQGHFRRSPKDRDGACRLNSDSHFIAFEYRSMRSPSIIDIE